MNAGAFPERCSPSSDTGIDHCYRMHCFGPKMRLELCLFIGRRMVSILVCAACCWSFCAAHGFASMVAGAFRAPDQLGPPTVCSPEQRQIPAVCFAKASHPHAGQSRCGLGSTKAFAGSASRLIAPLQSHLCANYFH